jgi:hypothetical protein
LLPVDFEYRLTGAGWARASITDGANQAVMTASYLSNALDDLLEAVARLLDGAPEARCSWEEEPGEYRWIFTRTGDDRVQLTILAFDDMWDFTSDRPDGVPLSSYPDERGELHFSTTQPLGVLGRAITDGAGAVLSEHGEDGYLAEWGMAPFPTARLAFIRQQLGA